MKQNRTFLSFADNFFFFKLQFDRLKAANIPLLGLLGSEAKTPVPNPLFDLVFDPSVWNVVNLKSELLPAIKPASGKNAIISRVVKSGLSRVGELASVADGVYNADFNDFYAACSAEVLGEFTPVSCTLSISASGRDENGKYKGAKQRVTLEPKNKLTKIVLSDEFKGMEDISILVFDVKDALGGVPDTRVIVDSFTYQAYGFPNNN